MGPMVCPAHVLALFQLPFPYQWTPCEALRFVSRLWLLISCQSCESLGVLLQPGDDQAAQLRFCPYNQWRPVTATGRGG